MAEDPRPAAAATPAPAAPGGADPTMEDILASIRRILNEDEPGAAPAPPPPASEPGEALALTEAMLVAEPAQPAAAAEPPVAAAPPPPPPPPPPVVEAAMPPPVQVPPPAPLAADALLAPAAAAAAASAMGQLLRAVSQDRAAPVHRSGGPSIEDVVREELRPLLKEWLDNHLPPLVERLVRAEIERVVSRSLG